MTTDLDLPVEVVGCPLVRELDGLAMSSRNAYLTEPDRAAATVLSKALYWASETVVRGERDPEAVIASVRQVAGMEPTVALEYVEVRSADELRPVDVLDGDVVVAVAARVGGAAPHRQLRAVDLRRRRRRGPRRPLPPADRRSSTVQRVMMKSKIHRATVTGSDLNYVGSITIDTDLMRRADLREHEQVHVLDLDNGARFETYVISGGPGDMILNGAAARLVHTGDRVIVISYAAYSEDELEAYEPRVVHVDEANRPCALDPVGT